MSFILTRPLKDSFRLRDHLENRGQKVILSPLLTIHPLAFTLPDLPYRALIATSANAFCESLSAYPALRKCTCFVVGRASAEAAQAQGFTKIYSAEGNGTSLLTHLLSFPRTTLSPLLYISGKIITQDFSLLLAEKNIVCTRVVSYEALAATHFSQETLNTLKQDEDLNIVFYSARTARIWGNLTKEAGENLNAKASGACYYCASYGIMGVVSDLFPKAHTRLFDPLGAFSEIF